MPSLSPRVRTLGASTLLAFLLAPASAAATEVAVPRLIGSGVDDKQLSGWTSSISSELDFMSEFTGATELGKKPAGFSASCLSNGACLSKVAGSAGCDATVAGAVSRKRDTLDFYLVYADGAKIIRTKEFTVEDSPSKVADTLSVKLSELITGESHDAATMAAAGTVDEDAFDDGFDDDDATIVAPVGGVSRRIPTNSSGGSDELDDFSLDEEEDDRRGGAAVVAAPPPHRAPPPPAEKPPPKAEPAEEEFSFALGGGVVSVDEAMTDDGTAQQEEDRSGGAIVAAGYGGSRSSERSASRDSSPRTAPARRDSREDYGDLDGRSEPDRTDRGRSDASSRSSDNTARVDRGGSSSDAPTVSVTGRLGYSRFQSFNFVTYGGEIAVHPIDNLALLAGIEGYSVRRDVPQELQDAGAPPVVWNSIMPINIGAVYKFLNDPARPYVGGDLLIIPGYVQDASGAATGLRIRGGVDLMVNETFGFNLNGALGIWSGKEFDQLDAEFATSAMVPQFSAGTVVAF